MRTDDVWLDVSDEDTLSARTEYRVARDRGGDPARVAALLGELELLWRVQARQIIRDVHRQHGARGSHPGGTR